MDELFEFKQTFFEFLKGFGFQADTDANNSFFWAEKCFSRFPAL